MSANKYLKCFGMLYGASAPMERLYEQVQRVAATEATVFITGESGTGKELLAQTIHAASTRRSYPFVAVNCGAIPPHLMESALFGHEKGSFTGAVRQHPGYFEQASQGTLFLDEITEMPPEMQVKLLRVLEDGNFLRVGGNKEIQTKARVLAATNREPASAVNQGKLRADLMYRLAVFPLRLPPLRERDNDIELLAHYFLHSLNEKAGTSKKFSQNSVEMLRTYTWPGNVRELKNLVQRAFILSSDILALDEVIAELVLHKPIEQEGFLNFYIGTPLADAQREIILATLRHFDGNKRLTSQTLGISLKTLYNRLKEYGLQE